MKIIRLMLTLLMIASGCKTPAGYEVLIRNGTIYDGSGGQSFKADIGINGDTIAFIGDLKKKMGVTELDARGLAVAPGFINMLSWANESLIEDGRSQSDLGRG